MSTHIPTNVVIEIAAMSDKNESDRRQGHLCRPNQIVSLTGDGNGRVRLHVFPKDEPGAGCEATVTVLELREALDLIEARADRS